MLRHAVTGNEIWYLSLSVHTNASDESGSCCPKSFEGVASTCLPARCSASKPCNCLLKPHKVAVLQIRKGLPLKFDKSMV